MKPLRSALELAVLAAVAALVPVLAHAQAAADAVLDAQLVERVQALVRTQAPRAAGAAQTPRVVVEVGRLDPRLRLAPCERVEPRLPPGRLWGRTRVGLRCVQGPTHWQVWLPLTVRVFAPGLVSAAGLPAGTVLTPADLQLAEVDWAGNAQTPWLHAAELVGRTLARPLRPGQAIYARDLRQRQWFAAGETVQVMARGSGFTVAGEALALGPGLEGQRVRLRVESGRVITARAVAPQRAEIEL
ncbi:MAG TPA: flagellar basal body P-ring formation chaperone FlgA [Rubrivivax sp.]|nr:flagellar basal body P-ring formation chaperone FlgA [Burkholderiales bacterium]HNT37780.1 flagellar basal body P-ring formation chaperone FlgA [Rubrivivax sp.]